MKKNWSDEDTKILLWTLSHYALNKGLTSIEQLVILFLFRAPLIGLKFLPLYQAPLQTAACLRSLASRMSSSVRKNGQNMRNPFLLKLFRNYQKYLGIKNRRIGDSFHRNSLKKTVIQTKFLGVQSNVKSIGFAILIVPSEKAPGMLSRIENY